MVIFILPSPIFTKRIPHLFWLSGNNYIFRSFVLGATPIKAYYDSLMDYFWRCLGIIPGGAQGLYGAGDWILTYHLQYICITWCCTISDSINNVSHWQQCSSEKILYFFVIFLVFSEANLITIFLSSFQKPSLSNWPFYD